MNFVAIDFETANEKRNSPCSLGITVIKNGKIIEEKYWLIKPPEMRFSNMNVMIHGIKDTDVQNEKEFNELWEEIKPYLQDKLVLAHNASFDISVLRKTLDTYGIEYPSFDYLCTMVMSRNFYRQLENAKLNTVNKFLGYEFNHHHAGADAKACANIFLNINEEVIARNYIELAEIIGVKIGKVFERGYSSSGALNGRFRTSNKIFEEEKKILNLDCSFFNNKVVVFTGPLSTMGRAEGIKYVRELGASIGSSVTKKTSVLIVGGKRKEINSKIGATTKLRRAMMLKENGQDIYIMNEEEFIKKISINNN